jgi:hypothetical protein
LIHLTQFAPEVIPGIFAFMYEGLSTSEVRAGRGLATSEANVMANLPD